MQKKAQDASWGAQHKICSFTAPTPPPRSLTVTSELVRAHQTFWKMVGSLQAQPYMQKGGAAVQETTLSSEQ